MALTFGTKHVEAQPMLAIRDSIPMDNLGQRLGVLYGEIYGYIQQSGQQPSGMPFLLYHSMDCGKVDFECGMPVAPPMADEGRIHAGELPAGTVATVTHMGPYEDLAETWSALTEWMGSQGLQPAGTPWEVYVTDPGAEPDESKWRTDIFFPVR